MQNANVLSRHWIACLFLALGVAATGCGAPDLTFADEAAGQTGAGGAADLDASVDTSAGGAGDASVDQSVGHDGAAGSAGAEASLADNSQPDASTPADAPPDLPVSCKNGVKDGTETDIDCGGPICAWCGVGKACLGQDDCASGICLNKICRDPSCSDYTKNGDETDVDCGGSCHACQVGQGCLVSTDCVTSSCGGDTKCAGATCTDSILNDGETDIDCGGTLCPTCADGKLCTGGVDCQSGICTNDHCVVPACNDGIKNGTETGKDCSGLCATKCPIGEGCSTGTDCVSGSCVTKICQAAGCANGIKSGSETDIDCGGTQCAPCKDGLACLVATDCASSVCATGALPDGGASGLVCQVPSCTDGVKNGSESDQDCGGSCTACAVGKTCRAANDCASSVCGNGICAAATCSDGVKNGNETDGDCGGGACAACAPGKACVVAADCDSFSCASQVCQAASCSDGIKNHGETGVDCGGPCTACSAGTPCVGPSDCASKICVEDICQPATCSDGVANGGESDTDCGAVCAGAGKKCVTGKLCGTGADCISANCVGGTCSYCKTGMVAVPKPSSGTYCIDATEVTQQAYSTWLATNPSTTGQPYGCGTNYGYRPDSQNNSCTNATYTPATTPNKPVVCIDWCDAYMYCSKNGKRLCGGFTGGSVATTSGNDATASQWYRACTAAGTRTYPYVGSYAASACAGADKGSATVNVASLATCEGGYPGLFDMSGNAQEWENSCTGGSSSKCQLRGGSYTDHAQGLLCSANTQSALTSFALTIGFRCCAD